MLKEKFLLVNKMKGVYVLIIGVTIWGTILLQASDGIEDGWRKNLFLLLMIAIFFWLITDKRVHKFFEKFRD